MFLSLTYLKSIENTVEEVKKFIYVIYYNQLDKPIGKSIFQLLEYDSSKFNYDSIPCNVSSKLLRKFLNNKITILISGNIFATGKGFEFNHGISDKIIFKEINRVIDVKFHKVVV